jgi:hypothetical protein
MKHNKSHGKMGQVISPSNLVHNEYQDQQRMVKQDDGNGTGTRDSVQTHEGSQRVTALTPDPVRALGNKQMTPMTLVTLVE